jgi:hypothetical protein
MMVNSHLPLALSQIGTLDGVRLDGNANIVLGSILNLTNGLVLNGAVTIVDTGSLTFVDSGTHAQSVTTTSAGSIVFSNTNNTGLIVQSPVNPAVAQTVTFGPGITVRGARGLIGSSGAPAANEIWVNNGTINADVSGATITLNTASWTNNGIWQASNGGVLTISSTNWMNHGTITETNSTLNLGGGFTTAGVGNYNRSGGFINVSGMMNNIGNTLALNDTTGSWQVVTGGTIRGGTVTTMGAARLNSVLSQVGTLDGVRVDGNVNVALGSILNVTNGLVLNGTMTIIDTGSLTFLDSGTHAQSVTTTSAASIVFSNTNNTGLIVQNPVNPGVAQTVTFGPGVTVRGARGLIGSSGAPTANETWINNGTISADVSGATITLNTASWTNNGTFQAQNGGTLVVQPTTLTNYSAGVLTGGIWNVFANSKLRVINAGISGNAATILLDGTTTGFQRDAAGNNALTGLTDNLAAGSITVRNGGGIAASGAFTNAGALTVGPASTFSTGGNFTQVGGFTIVDGTVTAANTVTLNGGFLSGSGTVQANLINNAQVIPGGSPGRLTVQGNYTQLANGVLDIELGGTVPISQYDQLQVSGSATLGGTLNASLLNGFTPVLGQTFLVVNYANVSGDFATYNPATLVDALVLTKSVTAGSVILGVVQLASPTEIDLSSDHSSGSLYGQSVVYTAMVSATQTGFGTPTGTVQFLIDGNNHGAPVSLIGGTGSINTAILTAGNHAITVIYVSNSSMFEDSNADPLSQQVNPAALTVSADHQTKVYGTADPALTYIASGFQLSDASGTVLTGDLDRVVGENVAGSPYAINQGTLVANSNYTISFTGHDLLITPATLTIAADHQTKVYGTADPILTYVASGFQFSDTSGAVLTGSLDRAAGESVAGAPYAITQGTLSANSNYTISFTGHDLSITPALTVAVYAIDDVTVNEGAGTLTFTVSVSEPVDIPVTIDVNYSDVSTSGGDFDHTLDSVVFPALSTVSQTVTVAISNDNMVEMDETFTVSLDTPTAMGGRGVDTNDTGTGTIQNNDTANVTITDIADNEGNSGTKNFVFTVTLSSPASETVTVDYHTVNDLAIAPEDYAAIPATTLTFNPGETSKPITVVVQGDIVIEPNETFFVNLSNAAFDGATDAGRVVIIDDQGVATITNDDSVYSIIALNPTMAGALSISGNATINVGGTVTVNSTHSAALSATGNSRITAGNVNVAGGSQITGNSVVSPAPTLGSVADPLAGLATPCPETAQAAVRVTGGSLTIMPGTYPSIDVAGTGSLVMTSGVYVIKGGGFKVSGQGSVTGTGVSIVNTTSLGGPACAGSGGTMGAFNVSGNGNFSVTPPSSGALSDILVYQPAANTKSLSISGNATLGITGTIYAPKAQVTVSGNGTLSERIFADRVRLSGNAGSSLVAGGTVSEAVDGAVNAGQLITGLVWVSVDGSVTATEQLRLADAIGTLNNTFGPYGVNLVLVDSTTPGEDIRVHDSNVTPVGGKAEGVLGYAATSGDIYIVNNWSWSIDSDIAAISATQYDYQTVITHELGHAIGLEHSSDGGSVMYSSLNSGVTRRGFTEFDLSSLVVGGLSSTDTDRRLNAHEDGDVLSAHGIDRHAAAALHDSVPRVELGQSLVPAASTVRDVLAASKPVPALLSTVKKRSAKAAVQTVASTASHSEAVSLLFSQFDIDLDNWVAQEHEHLNGTNDGVMATNAVEDVEMHGSASLNRLDHDEFFAQLGGRA